MLREKKGITLIALVITIIVLLILAGVTIATLFGDNGILTKATEASEKSKIGDETEIIKLAYNACKMDETNSEIETEKMRLEINQLAGEDKATVQEYQTEKIVIAFKNTGNVYMLNKNAEIEKVDVKVDEEGYVIVEGTADEWRYTVEDGVATITKYLGDETEFTIPNYINEDGNLIKVTTIGNSQPLLGNISYGNESITKVIISEGIEEIAIRSFRNFKQLLSINIPSTVIDIGAQAFYGCTNLENIEISSRVTCVSKGTFSSTKYYTQLKENSQENEGIYLGKTLVEYTGNRNTFQIKEGTIGIGSSVFSGCTSLENVEIPNGVTIIGSNAFYNCTSLTSIEIPGSVESIGASAFSNCSGLTNINIQEGVKNIGNGTGNSNVFNNCTSIQEIVIPSTVEIISLDDFDGMESLETLTLKCKCPENSFIIISSSTTLTIQSTFNVPNLKDIYVAPEFLQGYIDYLEKYNYDTSLFKSY